VIIVNAAGPQRVLTRYVMYYERSRTHLALDKDAPASRPVSLRVERASPPSAATLSWSRALGGKSVAADFFVVPTVTDALWFVLVILAHDRRRIVHVAVTELALTTPDRFLRGDRCKMSSIDRGGRLS
jgi:hypothetical protein